jgi:hydroxymethylpyrimidine pyrophosphatase-like HAD family hydrolase
MLARSEEMQRMQDFSSVQHSLTSWPSIEERHAFEAYDKVRFYVSPYGTLISTLRAVQIHSLRAAFVKALQEKFPDYPLTYSIGGQISFDVFPHGWDKTYALRHVQDEGFTEVHFFGDKTYKVNHPAFADVSTCLNSLNRVGRK